LQKCVEALHGRNLFDDLALLEVPLEDTLPKFRLSPASVT